MSEFSRRGVSPVVLALILVVLVLGGAIMSYVFLFGVQEGFNSNPANTTGVNAIVTPTLYSRDAKVGLYGDSSNISVSISNSAATAQAGVINITSNGRVVRSVQFMLRPQESNTIKLSQRLNATGTWSVKVTASGISVTTYYFQVLATRDEAEFATTQWRSQNYYRNLTLGTLIVSIASFIIAAASFARRPKTIIQT
jgi:hypothetical protein